MPSKKPKLLLIVDNDLIRRIDDFRFENRIHSRSEAIRQLIKESLKRYEKKSILEAKNTLNTLLEHIQKFGGTYRVIFHNESLSNDKEWAGYKELFELT